MDDAISTLNTQKLIIGIDGSNNESLSLIVQKTPDNEVRYFSFLNPLDNVFSFNAGVCIAFKCAFLWGMGATTVLAIDFNITKTEIKKILQK